MNGEFLWSLVGGVTATIFNVLYNYIQEARSRRWIVIAEITGKIDFYYLSLVKAVAHLESVFKDKEKALFENEWRTIQMEASPLFVDEQRIRAEIDIVYGVGSYESREFDEVFRVLKEALSMALSTSSEQAWEANKGSLKASMNQLATLRPPYRKKLVKGARLWAILKAPMNEHNH